MDIIFDDVQAKLDSSSEAVIEHRSTIARVVDIDVGS